MLSGEVGKVHGAIDAHAEGQQRHHLDDQALAEALESEEEEDYCYYDVKIVHQLFSCSVVQLFSCLVV